MSDGASDGVSSFGPEGKREAGARPARSRHGNELRYDMQGVVKVSLTRSMESASDHEALVVPYCSQLRGAVRSVFLMPENE